MGHQVSGLDVKKRVIFIEHYRLQLLTVSRATSIVVCTIYRSW